MKHNPLLENRDPKRGKRVLLGAVLVFWVTFSLLMVQKFPMMRTNIDLYYGVQSLEPQGEVPLNELVPFSWDALYTFPTGTSKEAMAETMGIGTNYLAVTGTGQVQYYFLYEGELVCAMTGHPESTGFVLEIEDSPVLYSDHATVAVSYVDFYRLVVEKEGD